MKNRTTFHIDDSKTPTRLKVMVGKRMLVERKFGTLGACMAYLKQNTSNDITVKAISELRAMKQWIRGNKFSFTPKKEK